MRGILEDPDMKRIHAVTERIDDLDEMASRLYRMEERMEKFENICHWVIGMGLFGIAVVLILNYFTN